MAHFIKVNVHPTPGQLRVFGLLLAAAFCAIGVILHKNNGGLPYPMMLWCCAGLAAVLTAAAPRTLRYPYLALTYAALPIGVVVSTTVLLLIFYLLLTPLALLFKIIRRDALDRRIKRGQGSYWNMRRSTDDARRYLRQY